MWNTLLGRPDKNIAMTIAGDSFNNQHYAQTHQTVRHINRILFKIIKSWKIYAL